MTAKKKGFMNGYKTYDPEKEGYGDAKQWQKAFDARMGFDEACEVLNSKDPHTILGLVKGCDLADIKKAFRKLAKMYHPDVNPSPDAHTKMQEIIAAYTILIN